MPDLDASRFLEDLSGRYAKPYYVAVQEMVVAMARGNRHQLADAKSKLARAISETMGIGEVLGASLTLKTAAGLIGDVANNFNRRTTHPMLAFASTPAQALLPRVTFTEAVEDMVTRTPMVIKRAAERTAQRIAQLYTEGHVVAFVRSAEQAVTDRVQSLITESIKEGIPEAETGRLIAMEANTIVNKTREWTEGYSRMAFRTNTNTAVTAGRFRQAQDQDIAKVIPAFRYDAVGDNDTRPNHEAADGLIMSVDNPQWDRIAPPLGYNCRCTVVMMGRPQLRRMGLLNPDGSVKNSRVPSSAHPDEGFRHGGRPDLLMVREAGV